MAYVSALTTGWIGDSGILPRMFVLYTDSATGDIDAAGFVTDADDKGMKVGDMVLAYTCSTVTSFATAQASITDVSWHMVESVSAAGVANLSVRLSATFATGD